MTWYNHDWMQLDPKLRTSCVEGISSFLSLFDMEDVAAIFCPKAPPAPPVAGSSNETENADKRPPVSSASMRKHLPPLDELIETGKVLALNMPAGSISGAWPAPWVCSSKMPGSRPCSGGRHG